MALTDHIERLRAKPERERRQIALATSGAITLVVFLGWVTAFVSSDALALNSGGQTPSLTAATEGTANDVSKLLGAASTFQNTINSGPAIRVVETNASSTLETNQDIGEQTVIPF